MNQIRKAQQLFYLAGTPSLLPLLSACLYLSGCTEATMNMDITPESKPTATIHLHVGSDAAATIATRAFDDSSITDLHILVYDSNNQLTGHQYATADNVTMQAESGAGCTIFAIANTGNASLFNGTTASTIDKLKAMVTNGISSVDGIKSNDCLLMSGSLSNVTINGGTAVQTITGLTVDRLAAKITLNVTTVAGITITGYSIKNLPSKSYLIARPNTNEAIETDAVAGDDAVNTRFNMPEVNASSVTGLSFYMYENRRGDRVSVNGTTGDITNQQQKALYAPDNATYVEVYTKGKDYTATYKIYLGADNCRNYNVKRNSTYTCDANITGVADVDTRVTKVAFPSNCYMVVPGKQVVFPVSRANEDGTTRIADETSGWTAELLWTDNIKGVKADGTSCIKSVTAQLESGTIKVETGSMEGNAVLVVKVGITTVWSWHIWVTKYDAQTIYTSYDNGYSTAVFMDRNVGAVNNTAKNIGSYGLLYQWGRKDPFPASSALTGTTSALIYNASGTKLTESGTTGTGVKLIKVNMANNLNAAIQNPLTFYFKAMSPCDWYSSGSTQNSYLWNNTNGTKTVYDPCPEGWRVPVSGSGDSSPWYTSSSSDYKSGTFGNGWNWTNSYFNLGWYPAAGYRKYSTGRIASPGTFGYYWTATASGTSAYSLYFGKKTFNSSYTTNYRGSGCSVRCVREENN
jgi:uncharacterized protein (TIGR02145 family)